jgi:MsuE subfamily FMN reductase
MAERVLGISGSRAESQRTVAMVRLALDVARELDPSLECELLDLRATDVAMCDGRPLDQYDEATRRAVEVVVGADVYIVGSPIYRASYTGALKNLFDLVPSMPGNDPLRGKPIGFIATGGSDHHFLVIEHQFRPLAGFFGMPTAPTGVYVRSNQFEQGKLIDPGVEQAVRRMVAEVLSLRTVATSRAPRTSWTG